MRRTIFVFRHRTILHLLAVAAVLATAAWPRDAAAATIFGGATYLGFDGGGGIADSGFTNVLAGTAPANPTALQRTEDGALRVTATTGNLQANNQENALGSLFDGSASVSVVARLLGPFGGATTSGKAGLYLGVDANNNARLTLNQQAGGGKLELVVEANGSSSGEALLSLPTADLAGAASLDLLLTSQPGSNSLTAQYRFNGEQANTWKTAKQLPFPGALRSGTLAAGIFATGSAGPDGGPFQATYDSFKIVAPIQGGAQPDPNIRFNRSTLFIRTPENGFNRPTTLLFGPDGRLYVATQSGVIYVLTLDAAKNVTDVQTIRTIYDTPSTNQDGTTATVKGRIVLGLTFDPASTPASPILYVTHNDPRSGAGRSSIDTRSSALTRLVGPEYGTAGRVDVITGLPRSRDNHAVNGMSWGPDGWLYIAIAGNTNYGAASTYFTNLPESFLSSSIVRANVKSPDFGTRDVRNVNSWEALEPLKGQFELFATGLRNPYDLVWHSNNGLYVNMNNGNDGFGLTPDSSCPGGEAINPGDQPDLLVRMKQGDYAGHPNPARGQCIFGDGSLYKPAKPKPANYVAPVVKYGRGSFDGIAEYQSDVFNGAMRGNILAVTYRDDRSLRRVALSANGASATKMETLATFDSPLDVTTTPDGAIYVVDYGTDSIELLTPASSITCPKIGDPASVDSDGDGYTDEDESDAQSSICSTSSTPKDWDNDKRSDIHDSDDDNDGVPDIADQFNYDPANGAATLLPLALEWNPGDAPLGKYQDTGFTGTQISSNGPRELPDRLSVGVAGGFLGISATPGTSEAASNTHSNMLQVGINADRPFTITTSLPDPFLDGAPVGDQAGGLFFGRDQDNYVKLVAGANNGVSGIQLAIESDGVLVENPAGTSPRLALPGPQAVELFLEGDPASGTLRASYRVDSEDPAQIRVIGTLSTNDFPALASFFVPGAAAGLLATNAGGSGTMNMGFDYFRVSAAPDAVAPALVARAPAPNSSNVALTANVTATFSEQVAGLDAAHFTLRPQGGAPMEATIHYDVASRTATLDPAGELAPGTVYDVALTAGITDNAGNALPPETWSFGTGGANFQTYQQYLVLLAQ